MTIKMTNESDMGVYAVDQETNSLDRETWTTDYYNSGPSYWLPNQSRLGLGEYFSPDEVQVMQLNRTMVGGNGTGNYTEEGGGVDFAMPMYAQIIIILMYTTVSVLSVGGNVIVCYIVLAYQRMRTVTNYFIVNLACSDIMMSVLCIPFTFIANLLMKYWPFGPILCPIVTYAQVVTVFLSAFTLLAISLDRYIAIIYPLRPRMTTRQAAIVISVIWFLSLAVPLPVAILSRIESSVDETGALRDYCNEDWPSQRQRYIYSLVIMVLQYFLPLFVLMFTYTRIAVVIWLTKAPGEAENNRDQRMAASKRKMVKMMIAVVIIYALCWLPLHTITLVGDRHEEIWRFKYIQVVWIVCHWLAMSNCCYNPMVYCWMNSKFRNGFKYVLRGCPCVNFDNDDHGLFKMKRVNTYVTTMKSSVKEKRAIPVYGSGSSPMRYESQTFSGYPSHHNENIPLSNIANGTKRLDSSSSAASAGTKNALRDKRTPDGGYHGPEEKGLLSKCGDDC